MASEKNVYPHLTCKVIHSLEIQINQASRRVSVGCHPHEAAEKGFCWHTAHGAVCVLCQTRLSWEWRIWLFPPFWPIFGSFCLHWLLSVPHVSQSRYICRDTNRHTDTCNSPVLWRDSHRDGQFPSFCSYASGVPRDPAQAGNIDALWEYFPSPALNTWKPQRIKSQRLAKEQCWYLPTLIHDVVILLQQ